MKIIVKMSKLPQYGVVRVRKLLHNDLGHYKLLPDNIRAPQIGDKGTIVEIVHAPGKRDGYIVEMLEGGPSPIWISIFEEEELELVE